MMSISKLVWRRASLTSPILTATVATFLFLLNIVSSDRVIRVGTERWEAFSGRVGNSTLVLGFACKIGLAAKVSSAMPADYCHDINGTCIRGVCRCRRGYEAVSTYNCLPAKTGFLQIVLSVLSWMPMCYLLTVVIAAMYDAFVHGVFTIMERDTDGAVLESGLRPISARETSVTECGSRLRPRALPVRVEKIAEGVEYDWAYDSALDQDDDEGDTL